MHLTRKELDYWNKYLATLPLAPTNRTVTASIAGDEAIADQLLKLYITGQKSAGSGLVKDYKACGADLPQEGQHWIVLDSKGNPRCILKTVRVEIHPFSHVPDYVAEAEGEGDKSINHWRKAHQDFFAPYLAEWGIKDLEMEEVVVEFFELVYK